MNIPAHRLPLRDYQKDIVKALNDPKIDELLLVIARRGGKTTTIYSEGLVPDMVRNVLTAVAVYPTAKMGLDNFWTNIEDDGFKTVDHLPRELLASGGQSNSVDDMRRTLINGSVFRALGATNYEALRGANGKIYWFDEFADMPIEAVNVIAPITERNKGKRIYTGTPKIDGINGETMRRMHESFKADKTGTKYTCYIDATHYTTPEELEKIRQGYILRNGNDFKFRQEMLLDWGQSSSASYYGHIIANKKKDGTIGLYPYDTAYPVYTSWDLGRADNMAIIFWQDMNGLIRIIDSYETSQIGLNTIIPFIKSKPYNYAWHFLPWDGVVHSGNDNVRRIDYMMQNGISNVSTLRKEGVSIGIDRVLQHLSKTQINEPTCTELIRKLNLYKRKFNPLTGDYVGPEHNTNSHCLSGDTLVWTTEGKKPIKDLVDTTGYVYTDSGHIRPYSNVRKTREANEWLEINLENGDTIKCTPDHMLMVDGEFVPASLLLPNDQIQLGIYEADKIYHKKWRDHKSNSLGRKALQTLQRREILSVQLLFSSTSSSSVGALQWGNTQKYDSGPHRLEYGQQRHKQLEIVESSGQLKTQKPTVYQKIQRIFGKICSTKSNRMAQKSKGQRMALETWKRYVENERADRKELFSLWKTFYYKTQSKKHTVLPPKLQNESSHTTITGITRKRTKISTYNLEVKGRHNFIINSGVVSHNCADALRYIYAAIAQNWIDGKFVMAQNSQSVVSSLEYDTNDLETTYYF